MTFKKWNTYLGWFVFLIATTVYFMTAEDTVSLWDCGEYITAAYKLEVGHPPGAPLFMVLGRLFSFFAAPENVAVWINRLSGLSSSLTILFMFWSITLFGKKILLARKSELSTGDQIAILGSSFVGALAYTFSESFWFSAVEGEVYAMASLFTAVIFWAILKWDEEMGASHAGRLAQNIYPDRWLLLILFLLGLAIGVHLLGILVVPAIGYVIYFRYKETVTVKGFLLTGIISVVVLGFIQEGVIPGTVAIASSFEVMFKDSLGLPFYAGTIFFFALIIFLAVYLIRRARKTGNTMLYNITMGMILLLIGYGSFAVIVIRSNANTPLDENDPENLVTLHAYLKREQYGSNPIFFGQQWNSKMNPQTEWKDRSPFYVRRFTVIKGDTDIKGFKSEQAAKAYANQLGGGATVEEKYFEANADSRLMQEPTYEQTVFFPRMYWSATDDGKVAGYKSWSGYDPSEDAGTEIGSDGQRLPSFGENMRYFFRYQLNWMYMRYFMWNFAGRQNDIQGHGDQMRGNWISGFSAIDNARLGDQGENAPYFTSENPSNNKFFFLPLILGLIGLVFHFYRAPKDAFVLLLVFMFTGLAILVYLNQKPFEPRERDYAYAGSFYFFAMWIGLGVLGLYDAFMNFTKAEWKKIGIIAGVGLLGGLILDKSSDGGWPNAMSWMIMLAIGGGAIALMMGLKKVLKSDSQGAVIALALGLFVPIIMGMQGWDDHDRSDKTSAHDLAYNYLNSCGPNGILFTQGDNDTFPLWYMQEVEGVRTDVRVANLSLMQTDWYTDQMKMKAYESDPLPIKFREDQILMSAGNTDQFYFLGLFDLYYQNASEDLFNKVINLRLKMNRPEAIAALAALNGQMGNLVSGFTAADANTTARLESLKRVLTTDLGKTMAETIRSKYTAAMELLTGMQSGTIKATSENQAQAFQKAISEFDKPWSYTNLKDAMAFVRDDANMLTVEGRGEIRVFPSSGFILDVNAANAVKAGTIQKGQEDECLPFIKFTFKDNAITREQAMMLDIMANNEWKRGIYFSSPGGAAVPMALYEGQYLKQTGMNYEISPLADHSAPYKFDQMYTNLMENFHWGKMDKPGVLTDYYTRRETEKYRQHFEVLADGYLRKVDEAEQMKKLGAAYIENLKANNQMQNAVRYEYILKNADNIIKESKKRAVALIQKSVQIMPVNLVYDHGEAKPSRDVYRVGEAQYQGYSDGSLHGYVEILFRAGANDKANKLGLELAPQLESIIQYYLKSNPGIAFSDGNIDDLYAAMDSYFKISVAAIEFDKNGALAKRTKANMDAWYNKDLPAQYAKLKSIAEDNGESTRRSASAGMYAKMLFNVQDQMEAMAIHYGLMKDPAASSGNMNLDQMLQGQ
ncbi:MAG: DUF2723 domain-containing protein [Crocinitomicaceae bacterium]